MTVSARTACAALRMAAAMLISATSATFSNRSSGRPLAAAASSAAPRAAPICAMTWKSGSRTPLPAPAARFRSTLPRDATPVTAAAPSPAPLPTPDPPGAGLAVLGDSVDFFVSVCGSACGGVRQQRGAAGGADLRYDMEIRLEDAFTGTSRGIQVDVAARCDTCDGSGAKPGTSTHRCTTCGGHGKVRAQQGFFMVERTCPACQGAGEVIADPCGSCRGEGRVDRRKTLTVTIPPGVDEGTRIRLSGEGESGARGAAPGDLYIFLHMARHRVFEREGTTLFTRAPISFTTEIGRAHV